MNLELFPSRDAPAGLPRVVSIHRSNGGVPKLAIPTALITAGGIEGDVQRNLKYHGGPDRALCLYSLELIEALREEGHPITPGSIGENILLAGVDWARMVPGARLQLGKVEIELTTFARPCRKIGGSFKENRVSRVSPKTRPGWSRIYARVLVGGELSGGAPVTLL